MSSLAELRLRRERLVARSAVQRVELARELSPLSGPVSLVERGLAGIDWLRRHPVAIALGVAAVVVIRPRRILGGVLEGAAAWRIARTVLPVVGPLLGPLIANIAASRGRRKP